MPQMEETGLALQIEGGEGLGFRKLREFNLAMLAKHGWKLATHSRSLMSRILKYRYFAKTDFLNTQLGSIHSFIWQSILETKVKNNIIRKVGNGKSIQVWANAWLKECSS
ncbi:unnamed protein product [Cuscuta europaea]|uniref:Uncharacterized protein n=1 Tax=Cuscuta europaea TaxID=41803 RepID=A0A9P0ZBM6_CUSEU|nr:unnamed protein product [Cuscuta europaea]